MTLGRGRRTLATELMAGLPDRAFVDGLAEHQIGPLAHAFLIATRSVKDMRAVASPVGAN